MKNEKLVITFGNGYLPLASFVYKNENENSDLSSLLEEILREQILPNGWFGLVLSYDELETLAENKEELAILMDENILNEKSIVKFDKPAREKRLEAQSIIVIARERGDRDLNKLLRVWKMRKILLDRLKKKYGNAAKQRARQMMRNFGKSKSKTANRVASKRK